MSEFNKDLENAYHRAMNPEGASIAQTLVSRVKMGHHTFANTSRGAFAIKATGVALGAAMTLFGMDHAIDGMREEPKPNLSHEGVNVGHVLSGLFCAGVGTAIMLQSYTKPLGVKSTELMEAVIDASQKMGR